MRNYLATMCLSAFMASAALAQEKKSVPPPPKPADSGPTLEETMKFIQKQLNEQGKVSTIHSGHDTLKNENQGPWKYVWEMSQVSAEPASCRVSWQLQFQWPNPAYVDDSNLELALRDVTMIEVISAHDEYNRNNAKQGHPEWVAEADPPIFFLDLYLADGKSAHGHVHKTRPNNESSDEEVSYTIGQFSFREEELANRVAKALTHAVELCGGGSKPEPF